MAQNSEQQASGHPLRIATFAAPLSGNKGSASMLIGLFDDLNRSGHAYQALVYSYYPERDAQEARKLDHVEVRPGHPKDLVGLVLRQCLYKIARPLLPASWQIPCRELENCDVVCLIGGTTFADSMLYKTPWNLLAAMPAMLARRPYVFLSQTMGPFRRPLNRWLAKAALKGAAAIHARGPTTEKLLHELGFAKATYRPDLSIGMAVPKLAGSPNAAVWIEKARSARKDTKGSIVGITPNTIVAKFMEGIGSNYPQIIADLVDLLVDRGDIPVLIPHSFLPGVHTAHNNDTGLCQEILRLSDRSTQCIYVEADLTSAELRALVGELDVLVASRFHSMVSALVMETPVITIGWGNHKYTEVLTAFGQGIKNYIPYEDLSIDKLVNLLNQIYNSADKIESSSALRYNIDLKTQTIDELNNYKNDIM